MSGPGDVVTAASDLDRLLLPDEAAAWLGMSPRTLSDWRIAGTGPRFVKIGRLVRYRVADLQEWVAARTQGGAE